MISKSHTSYKKVVNGWEIALTDLSAITVGLAAGAMAEFQLRNPTLGFTDEKSYIKLSFKGVGPGIGFSLGAKLFGKVLDKIKVFDKTKIIPKESIRKELVKSVSANRFDANLSKINKPEKSVFTFKPCTKAFCLEDLDGGTGVLGFGSAGHGTDSYTPIIVQLESLKRALLNKHQGDDNGKKYSFERQIINQNFIHKNNGISDIGLSSGFVFGIFSVEED